MDSAMSKRIFNFCYGKVATQELFSHKDDYCKLLHEMPGIKEVGIAPAFPARIVPVRPWRVLSQPEWSEIA